MAVTGEIGFLKMVRHAIRCTDYLQAAGQISFLCGESGILARFVQWLFGLKEAPWSLRGWGALLLFHTYTMYPFF